MKINKMGLAWVTVASAENSKKFYTETLGLNLTCDAQEHGWMELAGEEKSFSLGVGQDNDQNPIKVGGNAVITLSVDDIVAAKAELEGKGITFIGDIQEIPGHVKLALFQDPDGNHLQLVQNLD